MWFRAFVNITYQRVHDWIYKYYLDVELEKINIENKQCRTSTTTSEK